MATCCIQWLEPEELRLRWMRGEELKRTRDGAAATRRCREGFAMALAPYGIDRRDVPSAFVPLVNVEVQRSALLSTALILSHVGA
jgi:hypothetical protein